MLTYFSIKFDTSIGIEKENVSGPKFRNFDAFSLVRIRERYDLFKRKWRAEALIHCPVLSPCDMTDALICQFSTGSNLIIKTYGN